MRRPGGTGRRTATPRTADHDRPHARPGNMSLAVFQAGVDGWCGVPSPAAWATRARCRTAPTSLFFTVKDSDVDLARQVCGGCPVLVECREYALAHPRLVGVWAGLTVKEREGLRSGRLQSTPPLVTTQPHPEPASLLCPACGYGPVGNRKHCPGCLAPLNSHRPGTPRGTLLRTLTDLADHPGRWARVARYATPHSAASLASQLRNGRLPTPPGRWRFEGRAVVGGGSDLYACLLEEAS